VHRRFVTLVSAFSPPLFERAVFLRPGNLVSSPACEAYRLPLSCEFYFLVVMGVRPFSETTSLTVVHWMSGNAWSYWRLVAYGFIRLSEGA
jgi:hypothetical protein